MRIIFTDKLSKMVAHYENLRNMILELATWRDPGKESIQYHGQDLLTKNPERNSKRYQQLE